MIIAEPTFTNLSTISKAKYLHILKQIHSKEKQIKTTGFKIKNWKNMFYLLFGSVWFGHISDLFYKYIFVLLNKFQLRSLYVFKFKITTGNKIFFLLWNKEFNLFMCCINSWYNNTSENATCIQRNPAFKGGIHGSSKYKNNTFLTE